MNRSKNSLFSLSRGSKKLISRIVRGRQDVAQGDPAPVQVLRNSALHSSNTIGQNDDAIDSDLSMHAFNMMVEASLLQTETPWLPLAAWKIIFAYIWNDPSELDMPERRRTLINCAVAHPSFAHIILDLTFPRLKHSAKDQRSYTYQFSEIVRQSPSAALCAYELSVSFINAAERAMLPEFLPHLQNLKKLSLDFGRHSCGISGQTREKLPTYFRSVKCLRLQNVTFRYMNDLLDILHACSQLESLRLSSIRCREPWSVRFAMNKPTWPIVLIELILEDVPPEIVMWLTEDPFKLSLASLETVNDGVDDEGMAMIAFMVDSIGKSLKHLKLGVAGQTSQGDFLDLSGSHHLSMLCLQVRLDAAEPQDIDASGNVALDFSEWMFSALASVNVHHLRRVKFILEVYTVDSISALNWKKLDEELERLARACPEQLLVTFDVVHMRRGLVSGEDEGLLDFAGRFGESEVRMCLPRLKRSPAALQVEMVSAAPIGPAWLGPLWAYTYGESETQAFMRMLLPQLSKLCGIEGQVH